MAMRVLLEPVITEKAAQMSADGTYAFHVTKDATKKQVSRAIREAYGIKPAKVNMINVRGKSVRVGRRTGRRSDMRKALVFLPKGRTLDIYEGV